MIRFYIWRDGGGEYAAVIQPREDGAQITLFGDEVLTYQADIITSATKAQVAWIEHEWSLDTGYAAVTYDDVRDDIGKLSIPALNRSLALPGPAPMIYLIVAESILYAITL